MRTDFEYIVLGIGGFGSAAAYWLSRKAGAGVLGPEAFDAVPFLDLLTDYGSPWGLEEVSAGSTTAG